jgi:CO/xanthine dehydrogenase FAD-binding subunit
MPIWKQYFRPSDLYDVYDIALKAPRPLRFIAGGTDLLLDLRQGRLSGIESLIDLSCVSQLNAIEERGDEIFIGACVPLNIITASPMIKFHATALYDACMLIAGSQVRNVATLGGNVAHALPAADGAIALLSHAATVNIAFGNKIKRVEIASVFVSPGKTILDPQSDIIIGFNIKKRETFEGSAFGRIMRPQGVALPILNGAVWLRRKSQHVSETRVVIGPSGPTPIRAKSVELILTGHYPDDSIIYKAVKNYLSLTTFRTSPYRASSEYREILLEPFLKELVYRAYSRAELIVSS